MCKYFSLIERTPQNKQMEGYLIFTKGLTMYLWTSLFDRLYPPEPLHFIWARPPPLVVGPSGHSLESPIGVLHNDCTGVPQDEARNPALSCGALVSGGSEHQKHVLLIAGQNLNDLSLIDVYLILLHCRVIVCHQHGGDVATAATFTL